MVFLNMVNNPKISVVIPVYNAEKYLLECLDSVVNQTLKDIEIICVNDGSTDNSSAILEEYESQDERIKIINKPNSGYGHTMNVGLDNAAGEYIGIVESDDFVKPDMYETLYSLAAKYDLDLIKADFYRFVEHRGKLKLYYNNLTGNKKYYNNRIINAWDDPLIFRFIMNTWAGIYKKCFIEKYHIRHNETPGASYQDNGFWFQTLCRAERVYYLDKPFYMNRRDNPNSSVKSKDKIFCMCEEYDFIKNYLNRNPELKSRYIYIYSLKKYHNYISTYNRIAVEYKLLFLNRFSDEFKQAIDKGEIDQNYFNLNEWKTLCDIINSPYEYYLKTKNNTQYDYYTLSKNNVICYILSLPEKMIAFLRYWKMHGLKYSLRLTVQEIKIILNIISGVFKHV
jgi:glycosyltransferase involved in cell wall biosynthesis